VAHAATSVSSCLGVSAAEGGDLAWDNSIRTKSDYRKYENRIDASVTCEVSPLAVSLLPKNRGIAGTEALCHLLQDYRAQHNHYYSPPSHRRIMGKLFLQYLGPDETVKDPGHVSK
jgi:hypothetical protein